MGLQEVLITVTGTLTGDKYYARSYPDDDIDNNGRIELYETPVYRVTIQNNEEVKEWKALRFMPYWNDPNDLDTRYKQRGWANAGLSDPITRMAVTYYNKDYRVSNRPSPYDGAIRIKGSFLIHAGPATIDEIGWGSAGCIEVIGDFNLFKEDIRDLSGVSITDADEAILYMVKKRKLFITLEKAARPNLKTKLFREIP